MNNFDLKKYLAEGKLNKNKTFKNPSSKITESRNGDIQLDPIIFDLDTNGDYLLVRVDRDGEPSVFKGNNLEIKEYIKGFLENVIREEDFTNEEEFESYLEQYIDYKNEVGGEYYLELYEL
jgi:hypothetical protein